MLELCILTVDSPRYRGMLDLRDRVLRRPLGLVLTSNDTAHDGAATLVGAVQGDAVVGCCVLTRESDSLIQLRAMAVEPGLQRTGVGRAVVAFAETCARERGAAEIRLDARMEAVAFYARLGYAADGETYLKVGIPHRLMRKRI